MPNDEVFLKIETWKPNHHVSTNFDCGDIRLNNYFRLTAKRQLKGNMARVYVVVDHGQSKVLGYYSLNAGSMKSTELARPPRGTPRHGDIPILFLSHIAVDKHKQGNGIGDLLMHHLFMKAYKVADEVGCYAVLLDVLSDDNVEIYTRRKKWYMDLGFREFQSRQDRMFRTINDIRQNVEAGSI